jgi:hypothetical protein
MLSALVAQVFLATAWDFRLTGRVDLSTIANLVNAVAVSAGVIFAAVQIRHYRQRRRRAMSHALGDEPVLRRALFGPALSLVRFASFAACSGGPGQ